MKLFNRSGDCGVVAAFNITMDKQPVSAEIRLTDVEGLDPDGDYVCYAYFARKFYRVTRDTVLRCTLRYEDAETFCFYPIHDGKIRLGDTEKYVSVASSAKADTPVASLTFSTAE